MHNIVSNCPLFAVIMCPDLPNPLNGRIDFSIDKTAFFDYDTTATYVCDIGYGLTDEGAVRRCGSDETRTDGIWSGDPPTCEGVLILYTYNELFVT